MAAPRPFRHTPHTFPASRGAPPRAPVGASAWRRRAQFGTPLTCCQPPRESSTEGPSGCVRMAAPRPCRHTPDTFPAYNRPAFRKGWVLRQASLQGMVGFFFGGTLVGPCSDVYFVVLFDRESACVAHTYDPRCCPEVHFVLFFAKDGGVFFLTWVGPRTPGGGGVY